MRTFFAATLSILGLGLLVTAPVEAAGKATCSKAPSHACVYKHKTVKSSVSKRKASHARHHARHHGHHHHRHKLSYRGHHKLSKSAHRKARAAHARHYTKRKSTSARRAYSGSHAMTGKASYYWQPQRVASGGWFNPNAMTAAHKTLPFGTKVRVTNQHNGRSVVVTINDRGPYIAGRIIDLSRAAAHAISMQNAGVVPVKVAVLGR